jgi:hypothetical protein
MDELVLLCCLVAFVAVCPTPGLSGGLDKLYVTTLERVIERDGFWVTCTLSLPLRYLAPFTARPSFGKLQYTPQISPAPITTTLNCPLHPPSLYTTQPNPNPQRNPPTQHHPGSKRPRNLPLKSSRFDPTASPFTPRSSFLTELLPLLFPIIFRSTSESGSCNSEA